MKVTNRTRLVALAIVVLGGFATYWVFNRPAAPPAVAGAPLVAVIVPELTALEKDGEALYIKFCAACHGANAAGQDGVAPPFVHRIYEPNHHADGAFFMAAQNGVRAHHWPFGDMPPVAGINQDQVARIVTYVRAIQAANGIK